MIYETRHEARNDILEELDLSFEDVYTGDMRFGQLLINLFSFLSTRDPWNITDEEWPAIIKQYREKVKPGQYRGEVIYE